MRKITNLTEAFDSLNNMNKPKVLKEDLNPNTIHDYIDEFVDMEDLGLMALKWLSSDELVDMLEANGYEDVNEFYESIKYSLKKKSLKEARKTLGSKNRNHKDRAVDLCVSAMDAIEELYNLNGEDYIDLSSIISLEESKTLNKAIEILDKIGHGIETDFDDSY